MLDINPKNCSVGFAVKNVKVVEDLVGILMANGYWIRIEPKNEGVMIWMKEDEE